MPEKIQWSSASGTKEERLALEPTVGDVLNDQFHRLARGDHSLAPKIREALEIARWVNHLRRSQREGRAVASASHVEDDQHGDGTHACAFVAPPTASAGRLVWCGLTALAAMVGLALVIDAGRASSATYDETAYLRIAARWWRTGDQSEITRMGSPLTFWKLQQAPVLWVLDRLGRAIGSTIRSLIERELLPWMRIGSSWIWLMALALDQPAGAASFTARGRWLWRPGCSHSLPT